MLSIAALAIMALVPQGLAQAQSNETVLGVFMFHRHGDRTAKAWQPVNLTDLGYQEVYESGQYYHDRYVSSNADYHINGLSSDLVVESQISVSASADTVLLNSAQGFLQGLYPPVGGALGSTILANGSNITSPLNGYQLIPVSTISGGAGEEGGVWLQASTGCNAATLSSNNYFFSQQYTDLLNSTAAFYQSILPVINGTYNSSTDSYKNAYGIWDLINVAEIHNHTINSSQLITNDSFHQLFTLANAHEWGLAYNASDNKRAVAGMTLAGQVVQFLNGTITSAGKTKFGAQFGAYGSFASFFGLAGLQNVNTDFEGIVNYASAIVFELFTNTSTPVTKSAYPSTDEIYVRFLFNNGSASDYNPPTVYPLFGLGQDALSWNDFTTQMNSISINNNEQWCTFCGNTTGSCATYAAQTSNPASPSSDESSGSGNGLSPAVNGVIGAMVTLAVILGLEALILLIGGFRVVSRKRLAQGNVAINGGAASGATKA